jgi:acyl-CoA synthetase (AMP-forming)/AMP-acid ligase II
MAEYWKQPEQTASTLKNGWLHTGDIARADEQGYLFILDRKKDMVVTGGFNIFPREVEDVLATHPDVAMVAVIGVPHQKWGEAVAAIVVPRAGARLDPLALTDLVKTHKGSAHAPKHIEFVRFIADDEPRQGRQKGAKGKILGWPKAHSGVMPSARSDTALRSRVFSSSSSFTPSDT